MFAQPIYGVKRGPDSGYPDPKRQKMGGSTGNLADAFTLPDGQTVVVTTVTGQDPQMTVTLAVPSSQIGAVIGRAGATVRQIEATSQAKIEIEKSDRSKQQSARNVVCTGTSAAIIMAKDAIQQAVLAESNRRNGHAPQAAQPYVPAQQPYVPAQQPYVPAQQHTPLASVGYGGPSNDYGSYAAPAYDYAGGYSAAPTSSYGQYTAPSFTPPVGGYQAQPVAMGNPRNNHPSDAMNGEGAKIVLEFSISHGNAGAVIGKGGAQIRSIEENSAAKINLTKGKSERQVSSAGTPQSVAASFDLIISSIKAEEVNGGAPPPGRVSAVLIVTNTMVGAVIGKGGQAVRSIESTSGAKINVQKKGQSMTKDREVTIDGTCDEVSSALKLVAAELDAQAEKSTPA